MILLLVCCGVCLLTSFVLTGFQTIKYAYIYQELQDAIQVINQLRLEATENLKYFNDRETVLREERNKSCSSV